jgi:hypothetical protein
MCRAEVQPSSPSSPPKPKQAKSEACDKFIHGLGIVLSCWVQKSAIASKPQSIDRFHSSRPPAISVQDYIKRMRKHFLCSDECFVIALVYIDRVSKSNASMAVCDVTVHRLLLISVMLAVKFHEDKHFNNAFYGKVGGLALKEVNLLERVLLKELKWETCSCGGIPDLP